MPIWFVSFGQEQAKEKFRRSGDIRGTTPWRAVSGWIASVYTPFAVKVGRTRSVKAKASLKGSCCLL